jgi:phosphoribosyl 1,2-cyclic phosphate phosphodiesterase
MELIFLGTGPSLSIPRSFCHCLTCQKARQLNSRSARLRSSLLLREGKKNILIDVTPDILVQLVKARVSRIEAVLLTHAHYDAIGGLKDLNKFLKRQKNYVLFYGEKENYFFFKKRLGKEKSLFSWQSVYPSRAFRLFNFLVTPFRVYHSATPDFPTLGYRINSQLIYASDVKSIPQESEKFFKNISQAILDGCMWFNRKIPTHLNVAEAIELAEKFKIKKLYLTQISHSYPPYERAAAEIKRYCQKNKVHCSVCLAWDGLKFKI